MSSILGLFFFINGKVNYKIIATGYTDAGSIKYSSITE